MTRQTITVGNHDFTALTVEEWINTKPIPTNRDSERRVPKMSKVFDEAYYKNQISTLTEVALGIVTQDFQDPESGYEYKVGEEYAVDGNTRKHYWKKYPDKAQQVKSVTAKIHYLSNMDDVRFAYYPYNNAKSSEKASEILQGLRSRYNWTPRQQMFANGGYKTALDYATQIPGENKPDIFEAFNMCFDSLKLLDTIPKDGDNTITKPSLPELRSQSIIAACLLALRFNKDNLKLHDLIYRLSTITRSDLYKAVEREELDPVEVIAVEYTGMSVNRAHKANSWLDGYAGQTSFAAMRKQMDFLIYWIQKYIESPKKLYNFKKGIKPTLWDDAWKEFFPDEEI